MLDGDLLSFLYVLDSDYSYLFPSWYGDEVTGITDSLDRQYIKIIANANQLCVFPLIPHNQLLIFNHSHQVEWARYVAKTWYYHSFIITIE